MMDIGWIAAIIIGGLAGWLAGKLMDIRFGIFMNIVIGIVGALLANAIFDSAGIHVASGWLGYLVQGFVGSCILLFLAKIVRR
ncbi:MULTISPECIES: GlsB/YeaQ/YmgE family stress response membrane protein [unclassified Rhizobium]|uniref:GlsB/YeaQ/YmgE family stress response membrane protein n=1 Tax=unclassified Rhizobium TaxID=2613769 RepID=UPI000DD50C7F|nr:MULTISPECIES: GlsB/YeaQ/YmgE family stress response membrane protein [unclassified Rhizobium]